MAISIFTLCLNLPIKPKDNYYTYDENEIIIRCNKIKTGSYYTIKSIGYILSFLKKIYKDIRNKKT